MKFTDYLIKTIFFLSPVFFISCTIKYDKTLDVSDVIPEFSFEESHLTRYEGTDLKVDLKAQKIENYKNSNENFIQGVEFSAYDEDNQLATQGKCGLLYANTDKDIYELYDDIELDSISQKTKFHANALKWNSTNQQLISGKSSSVKIEKDDTVMYGSGFSASGVTKIYTFTGSVEGEIETK